ncbi:D-2-hydroxyacid dehydrogenase [Coraliomargarita sp. SDUM461004]|uniref:D-2-hydroxyacid dehydrogenase n=1 Tax=Thalassobacterium sedimentorum TaxID=3041258 RepID=A0ABU1AKM7_9BACT|nr:D-2-hydroxyacid dehydrogenase [Coraliomargarita sp. SDUM461004]MDQ8195343.1 D-2-hydroxyacid dehydrogenase [Coraliomargarita sp. SDUM461004]
MKMKIWCNLSLGDAERQLLCDGLQGHELIESQVGASSVLAAADHDESLYQADIALGQPTTEDVLTAPKLKFLQITSAGYTRYDTPAFRAGVRERNIIVANSSSVYDLPCAEHLMSFMLAQSRNLPAALAENTCGNGTLEWNTLRAGCRPLAGQSLLILGYGAIGEMFVKLLAPFDMEVVAVRRSPTGHELVRTVALDALPELLGRVDHVVNILPDSAETLNFVDAKFLSLMKAGATFYNIGRGTTVNQIDLADALRSNHLHSAWLDVTDPEPLPQSHPLRQLSNCYMTPHTAGGHAGESISVIRHFLKNLAAFESGQALRNQIM